MKTKREIYETYTKHGFCQNITCDECPFFNRDDCGKRATRFKKNRSNGNS